MLQPIPINMPPGIVATPTKQSKSANWRDGHLIRWLNGRMVPIGGWGKIPYSAFASPLRSIHRWTTNAGLTMIAYLCEGHLYVDQGDGTLTNISPTSPIVKPSDTIVAGGYGDFTYSYGTYGTARPDRTQLRKITPGYYLDNWGQNLLAMTGSDGRLLMWDPTSAPGTKAAAVAEAPIGNRCFVVTPQRFVMVFGYSNNMNGYAWCNQEDIHNWDFASLTSKAGFNSVQPASPIIAAHLSGNDVIFFTELGMGYYVEYLGVPYVFGGDKFSEGVTPLSPMSIIDTPNGATWIAEGGIWMYQSRQALPVACDIWDMMKVELSIPFTSYYGSMMLNPSFSEIWWFYSSSNTVFGRNDRALIYNYKDKWWSRAYISRMAGVKGTYTGLPLMTDGDNVYQHEDGTFYDSVDLPWAASFVLNAMDGAVFATIARMLPDIDGDRSSVQIALDYNFVRAGNDADIHQQGDYKPIDASGYAYFYETGRDFRMTIKQVTNGVSPWTLGNSELFIIPRGAQ